ncbi:DUF547 domain-containing protein [Acaryochloris sp. IP29b_bin.137]|uniref:DUF547 domain-containing protein n=1 Tax=Acaryochloris sp. IP29b_bin.137 TaxID=2969217 RepID=UPI00261052C9|nr:DUF547 domain-containing protein [Acaryochloris sp. IP29b_bin.137]
MTKAKSPIAAGSKNSDPRLHFALVCASMGCPLLRAEAYVPDIAIKDWVRTLF